MKYPYHVWFIPDGNRTRAKQHGCSELVGYNVWMKTGINLARYVMHNTPIQCITWRFMSTENVVKRDENTISNLLDIVVNVIDNYKKKKQEHSYNNWKYVNFAINYGWQDEICRAVQQFAKSWKDLKTLDKAELCSYIEMEQLPSLDLVIRTKWHYASRTSWFWSWSIWYAELYFTDTFCPDFTIDEFIKILERYDTIISYRNFGE